MFQLERIALMRHATNNAVTGGGRRRLHDFTSHLVEQRFRKRLLSDYSMKLNGVRLALAL